MFRAVILFRRLVSVRDWPHAMHLVTRDNRHLLQDGLNRWIDGDQGDPFVLSLFEPNSELNEVRTIDVENGFHSRASKQRVSLIRYALMDSPLRITARLVISTRLAL